MARRTKAGQFSPVSLEALEVIAKCEKKHPKLLLAYLALARHTTMKDLDGSGPNRFTGAGAKKVTEIAICGTPLARGMVNGALVTLGLIKKAPPGLPSKQALWAMQHQGTVNIPHALIDGIRGRGVKDQDGINRLLKHGASDLVATCAIMLLVYSYAEHDLAKWGGINHQLMWRAWKHQASTEGSGFRVAAEPDETSEAYTTVGWQEKVLASMGVKRTEENAQSLFWPAFNLLKSTGLIYEVVSVVRGDQYEVPVRLNDYHAATSEGEAALIADVTGSGFYTHKSNEGGEPEGCWFYLPSQPQKVIGVWRLRFRCSTPETAAGLERDELAVEAAKQELIKREILFSMA
jgi:hypothetical protein